ncbi:putative pentatricopeptide repeat-containing protein At3g18840 [Eucalyptus grandis]|uniref:putative pentatricopeptide repeat-containing protein At3g18840 n=1 Tax=Eucalyptus grandis TaxID=71139 RepID=UPI00192F0229|nr:putative pentatricopeptide repeat-containing protein At3g18840 [Eucalyptus grandis]
MRSLKDGLAYQARAVKSGFVPSTFLFNQLIRLYSQNGLLREAHKLFDEMPHRNVYSSNALISAYVKARDLTRARALFDSATDRDLVTYNSMLTGYVTVEGRESDALKWFDKMQLMRDRLKFDEFTLTAMLNLVAKLRVQYYGTQLHAYMVRTGNDTDKYVMSSLIDMYSKCGSFGEAYRVFCESKAEVDLVSKNTMMAACCREDLIYATIECENSFLTTSMIVGHSSQGNMSEARRLFDSLNEKNSTVWTALFTGYVKAQQWALDPGTQIHAYSLRKGMEMEEKLISATIDMYFKSGSTEYAGKISQKLTERDLILYNIVISGYANQGHEDQAMKLYKDMLERGLKPDEVAFIALLSACRHSGLVEMGEKYFKSVVEDYKIVPETDHYACTIDVYARANQPEKAMDIMKKIPRNSDLLANVFAAEENWAEMCKIREKMRGKETKKLAGCSWVYLENGIHAFTSGDTSHSKAEIIYSILEFLSADLRAPPNSNVGKVTTLTST